MIGDGRDYVCPEGAPWEGLIAAHLAGDADGTEELARVLEPALRQAARNQLGHEDRDVDDVVSESLIAVLDYLVRRGEFEGNLLVFAVTVARNRCRNVHLWRRRRPQVPLDSLIDWIADPERSPLDALLEMEKLAHLQEALSGLGPECEKLLRAFYIDDIPMEEIRHRLGLGTVQGAYYRRARCLKKALERLNIALAGCSSHAGSELADDSPKGSGYHE